MDHNDDPHGFSSLEGDFDNVKTKKDSTEKFTCPSCSGTGYYSGPRVHQEKTHCFSCRGLGYFKTDPRKLAARRARKQARKSDQLKADLDHFKSSHPDLYQDLFMANMEGTRSEFLASLSNQLFTKGSLSENQVAAMYRGKARLEEIKAQRQEEQAKASVEVDLTPIRTMFETAVESGYKKPTYRAEGLILKRAPDHGNNPGALYVKDEDDQYLGKIIGTTYHPTRNGTAASATLVLIASDPLGAALRYGQRTGRCACCGRELTKHSSIDLGIGPVCKTKWGL